MTWPPRDLMNKITHAKLKGRSDTTLRPFNFDG